MRCRSRWGVLEVGVLGGGAGHRLGVNVVVVGKGGGLVGRERVWTGSLDGTVKVCFGRVGSSLLPSSATLTAEFLTNYMVDLDPQSPLPLNNLPPPHLPNPHLPLNRPSRALLPHRDIYRGDTPRAAI